MTDVTEIFGEQSYRLRRLVELRYGYGFGQNRTTIESEDIDVKFKVARLTSSALIDRRQNPFDPRGGWFSAAGFELSRPGLGSDISFLKGFLQYYQFVPIGRHMMVASAARVGLAGTFEGQDLVPSERFFAGGATTVRGYREDDLGPRSLIGDNEAGGGRAILILNAELRFPIYRWLRGVGFVDVGNVYPARGRHLVHGSPGWRWRRAALRYAGRRHPARPGQLLPTRVPSIPGGRCTSGSGTPSEPRDRKARSPSLPCRYRPRTVFMIDWTAGLSGAFGASLRKFSK